MKSNNFIKGILYFSILLIILYLFSFSLPLYLKRGIDDPDEGKIGLIEIEGIIFSSDPIIEQIKKFKKNDQVKAIVVRIDSPGGAVAPSQEIYAELNRFREETNKKIVVSCGNITASGGYYIACAANKIVSNPGSITGSIAVIMKIPNLKKLFDKIGYEEQIIKSGKLKDIGSISRKLSDEERAILEDMAKDVHEQFIEAVSKSRNIDTNTVRDLADGRIFTGRKAKDLNLVDKLGSYEDAIQLAAKLVGITGEPKTLKIKEEASILKYIRDLVEEKVPINPFNMSRYKLFYLAN